MHAYERPKCSLTFIISHVFAALCGSSAVQTPGWLQQGLVPGGGTNATDFERERSAGTMPEPL